MKCKAICALAILAAVSGCSGEKSLLKRKPVAVKPVTVRVVEVRKEEGDFSKEYVGVAWPVKSTVLSCRHSGTLNALKIKQGQYVRRGEVIAVVESQAVESSRDMAYASLQQAQDGYDRVKSVYEKGSVAEVKIVEIRTKLNQAQAAVKAADRALAECTIKAPYSGVIGEVYVDEGIEIVAAEPIVKIMDVSSVEIRFPVPENEINTVKEGSSVRLNVPAAGDGMAEAEITSKGISASAISHTYECVAVPVSGIDGLMPGMVCKVRMKSRSGQAEIVVPASVVCTDAKGRYIWTVKEGKVVKTPVVIGGFSGDGVIVSQGLDEGDAVIVDGVRKVSSGMSVKVVK